MDDLNPLSAHGLAGGEDSATAFLNRFYECASVVTRASAMTAK